MDREQLYLFFISIAPLILLFIILLFKWRKSSFNDVMEKSTELFLELIQIPLGLYLVRNALNHELNVMWGIGLCAECLLLFYFDTIKNWLLNLLFAIHDHLIKH